MNYLKGLLLAACSAAISNYAVAQCTTPVITSVTNSGPVCEGGTFSLTAVGTVGGSSTNFARMVGVGANEGNREFDFVFSTGDRPGSIARITNAAFDAIFASASTDAARATLLKAQYDVLMFTWASPHDANITWGLFDAYLNLGGSIFIDGDYANVGNLAPTITSNMTGGSSGCSYVLVSPAPFPVLIANGVNGCFANDHLTCLTWPSWMKAYIKASDNSTVKAIAGIYPNGNHGRLIVQGPDQDFHAVRGGGDPGGNQYKIMLNQMDFLAANQGNFTWVGPNGFTATGGNPTLSGVTTAAAGVYTVTLTNTTGGGCTATATTTVTVNTAPTVYNVTGGGGYCSGGSGSAIGLSGSESGVSYQLKIGATNSGSAVSGSGGAITFGNRTGTGTYTVVATRTSGGCTSNMAGSVAVSINSLPTSVAGTVTQPACHDGNGTVVVSGTGGSGSYGSTAGTFTVVHNAAYSFRVTDGNGCTSANAITGTMGNPSAVVASASVTQPVCHDGNGSVAVSATGGSGSYGSTTGTFTVAHDDTYSYAVTDSRGCTSNTISGTIGNPDQIVTTASVTQPLCHDGTGSVAVSATGGTGSYGTTTGTFSVAHDDSYSYTVTDDNGCTSNTVSGTMGNPDAVVASATVTQPACNNGNGTVAVSATGGTGSYGSTTGTFTVAHDDAYSYTVTDDNGCSSNTLTGTMGNPALLVVSSATATDVSCNTANGGDHNNGAVAITVTGGTGSYAYSWDNGATTANILGIAIGTYNVTVTDDNGCTATGSATVGQPSALGYTSVTATDISCNNSNGGTHNDGTATVNGATGGTGSASYAWSNGGTTASISGLTNGTYDVTVSDANGCTTTGSATVGQPSAITYTSVTATDIACNNSNGGTHNDGTATVNGATGGTGTLHYAWSDGQTTNPATGLTAPATYDVTITDANSCTTTGSASVGQPTVLAASATATNASCNTANGGNHSDGSIATTVTGGTGSYSYAWSGGATGANPSGLTIGTYNATVTDAHGCTTTTSATVGQPSAVTASTSISPVNVISGQAAYTIFLGYGPSSVTVSGSASGGTSGYSYSWAPSGTCSAPTSATTSVSPTTTTVYTLTVTDSHSCTTKTTATENVLSVSCCAGSSGNCGKVNVCHNGHTICIDASAVPAHLAHSGDYLGACTSGGKFGSENDMEASADAVQVFPNPNDGTFSVMIPSAQKDAFISVSDMTGRTVATKQITDNNGKAIDFNLNGNAPGIYLVKVNAQDYSTVVKVVVR